MAREIRDVREMSYGARRTISVDLTAWFDGIAVATGTPTVEEVGTSALTIANKTVSTGILTINGQTVAIGKAVQFSVITPAAPVDGSGTTYRIRVTPTSNDTPSNYETIDLFIRCK